MKHSILLAALAGVTVVALASQAAAATYGFTISGSSYTGAGTLTTGADLGPNPYPCPTCANTDGYAVTSITGALNGVPITGLIGLGVEAGNDNRIYPGLSGPWLDWGDLGFAVAGVNYNVFQGDHGGVFHDVLANSTNLNPYAYPVRFTLFSVPEPATWALMLIGAAGLGLTLRAHRRADRELDALRA